MSVDLTGVGSISVPGRIYNPNSGGAWIAEGQPIPVRQLPLTAGPKLVPKKLACLCTFTEEMAMADSIEEFVRAAISGRSGAARHEDVLNRASGRDGPSRDFTRCHRRDSSAGRWVDHLNESLSLRTACKAVHYMF